MENVTEQYESGRVIKNPFTSSGSALFQANTVTIKQKRLELAFKSPVFIKGTEDRERAFKLFMRDS